MFEIMLATTKDFYPGQIVIYIPNHAGDIHHPDCEKGVVSSVNDSYVFVKFDKIVDSLGWDDTTSQSCYPNSLVTVGAPPSSNDE